MKLISYSRLVLRQFKRKRKKQQQKKHIRFASKLSTQQCSPKTVLNDFSNLKICLCDTVPEKAINAAIFLYIFKKYCWLRDETNLKSTGSCKSVKTKMPYKKLLNFPQWPNPECSSLHWVWASGFCFVFFASLAFAAKLVVFSFFCC